MNAIATKRRVHVETTPAETFSGTFVDQSATTITLTDWTVWRSGGDEPRYDAGIGSCTLTIDANTIITHDEPEAVA